MLEKGKTDKTTFIDDEARAILAKNKRIEQRVKFTALASPFRKALLADLVQLQSTKERTHMFIMGFFGATILLGLVSMTIETYITALWMYITWGILLFMNIGLVLGDFLYTRVKEHEIIKEYPQEDVVIVNPVVNKIPVIRTDRHGRPLHSLYNKETTVNLHASMNI